MSKNNDNDQQKESDFRHRERIQELWLKIEQLKAGLKPGQNSKERGDKK